MIFSFSFCLISFLFFFFFLLSFFFLFSFSSFYSPSSSTCRLTDLLHQGGDRFTGRGDLFHPFFVGRRSCLSSVVKRSLIFIGRVIFVRRITPPPSVTRKKEHHNPIFIPEHYWSLIRRHRREGREGPGHSNLLIIGMDEKKINSDSLCSNSLVQSNPLNNPHNPRLFQVFKISIIHLFLAYIVFN